jgi:hypothetical protein
MRHYLSLQIRFATTPQGEQAQFITGVLMEVVILLGKYLDSYFLFDHALDQQLIEQEEDRFSCNLQDNYHNRYAFHTIQHLVYL